MSQRISIKTYLFSIAALLSFAVVGDAQTYSGQAYTGGVKVSIVGQPVVSTNVLDTGDLPSTGGDIVQEAAGNYLLPGGVLSLGTRSSSTSGLTSDVPSGQSLSAASVQSVNLGALGFTDLVTAGVIEASTSATCPNPILTANSSVANLTVNGVSIDVEDNVYDEITVDLGGGRLLTVRVNERIIEPRSITANALHVIVTDPLAPNAVVIDVVVASARSGINCGLAPFTTLYSGRGTAIRVDQNSLLVPYLSTIAADTGWMPTTGTAPGVITSTTAGVGVAGLLTSGTVFSSTEGGNPAGTTASSSEVEDLGVDLDNPLYNPLLPVLPAKILTLSADVIESNTRCQCSAGVPICTGDSDLVGLTATALGFPVTIPLDFLPNTELIDVNIPLLASVRIVANEQSSHSTGTYGALDITALRIQIGALADLLLDTDIKIARSHSDIACSLVTTAAPVTLSGRVLDANGRAISRADVLVMDSKGKTRSATANKLGNYSIHLPSGEFYVVSASAKSYTFSPRTVSLNNDVSGFDLYPNARRGGKGGGK